MAAVSLIHLTRTFDAATRAGIFDFSLEIPDGEICTVVGPSGAGKTTLLRLIAGLDQPDAGGIRLAGRDVTRLPPQERDAGLLAQRPALYPHLSIRRNIAIGLEMWQSRRRQEHVASVELNRRVDEAVQLLDLRSVLDRRPEELSGGEQQRVALGRILVRRPAVWLLDEPLSHLDSARKIEFRRHLHLLRGRVPTTILLVTHDPVEALTLGQRLAVMDAGRLRQAGSPADVYARPADRFVAGFLGWPALNLAEGTLVRSEGQDEGFRFAAADGAFHLPVPAELATHGAGGQPVAVGIRPEELDLADAASPPRADVSVVLPGWRVAQVEFAPPRWLVGVERGQWSWLLWQSGPPPAQGQSVNLRFTARNLHWFDGRSGLRM